MREAGVEGMEEEEVDIKEGEDGVEEGIMDIIRVEGGDMVEEEVLEEVGVEVEDTVEEGEVIIIGEMMKEMRGIIETPEIIGITETIEITETIGKLETPEIDSTE